MLFPSGQWFSIKESPPDDLTAWQYTNWWSWHLKPGDSWSKNSVKALLVHFWKYPHVWDAISCFGYLCFFWRFRQTPQFRSCGIRVGGEAPGHWTGWEVIASYLWWIYSSSPVLLHEGVHATARSSMLLDIRFQAELLPEVTQFLRYHKEYRAMFESHLQTILQSLGMTEARLQLWLFLDLSVLKLHGFSLQNQ